MDRRSSSTIEEIAAAFKRAKLNGSLDIVLGINQSQIIQNSVNSNEKKLIEQFTVSYNAFTCILLINNKEVAVPPDSNQSVLCEIVFKNKTSANKRWDNSELLEQMEGKDHADAGDPQKIYRAARNINKLVQLKTGLEGLLNITTKETSRNPKISFKK